MPGPQNPAAADPNARGGQYVTVPGFASPGHSTPTSSRTAPNSTVVYSPKGWRWEEAGDDYSLAVSKMAGAAIEASVRRMRTTFGQVFYIKGNATTKPPFNGEAVGDTCRVQDGITLDIVAEWRWTGSSWERMQVDNQQISNLDVGKLTAGSASINELAARKIASDVGRFLELTTEQLTVTGNASFVDVTARHIWTRIVTAQQGEFEQIKAGMLAANSVSADNVQAGAIDGQVITGAVIQSEKPAERGLKLSSDGLSLYNQNGARTVHLSAHDGDIYLRGRVGIEDTWSYAEFTDITSTYTGNDTGRFGDRWGVGISFNAKANQYAIPGLVAFKDDPTIRGAHVVVQAPTRGISPAFLRLGSSGLEVYSGSESAWSLSVSKFGYALNGVDNAGFSGNNSYSGISMKNKFVFYAADESFKIQTWKWDETAIWANSKNVVMAYSNSAQAIVDSKGLRGYGGKNFIMRVPGEWKKRRMVLQHACTESPYDGIEYWENIELDAAGRGIWILPDYIPKIASPAAPWLAFTTSSAAATIKRTGYGVDASPWSVEVVGNPGEVVGVLVKGARQLDQWDEKTDEVRLWDRSKESVWQIPPAGPADDVSGVASEEHVEYGPTPTPPQPAKEKEESNNE
jgi:hypothetical protein